MYKWQFVYSPDPVPSEGGNKSQFKQDNFWEWKAELHNTPGP